MHLITLLKLRCIIYYTKLIHTIQYSDEDHHCGHSYHAA